MSVRLQVARRSQLQVELRRLVDALRAAADDARIRGLIAYVGGNQAWNGLAQVQELRNAVLDFRWFLQAQKEQMPYSEC
jgi:hypothetical protein